MKTRRIGRALVRIWCLSAALTGVALSADGPDSRTSDAWQALRSGEAVVLMRHALAPGTGDPVGFEPGRCETQRNLSDAGREQAVAMGDALRANGIEAATVLSSEWCRCLETARGLDMGDPEPVALLNSFFQDRSVAEEQTLALHALLDQWLLSPDGARVLVTHQVNIRALTGEYTGSGDMLIVTVEDGETVVLARLDAE